MNQKELKRYDRQMMLPELGIEGQQKLKEASVLIIGAGGLGSPALLYLAAVGIGRIGIIDHDLVEESNLQRQILFNTSDIGKNKAITAVEKLKLLNPHLAFDVHPFRLASQNAAKIINNYDLVLDCSDNFPTRYLVNDTCVELKKTFVFGSIFRFEGQISVFNYPGGSDYRSLYPDPPPEGEATNCGETGVIGTLPGIVGSYMANEAVKLLAGFGDTLTGKLMTIDALQNETRIFNLKSPETKKSTKTVAKSIQQIDQSVLNTWSANKENILLVDVRENYEYEEQNIGGINIPLYELPERITELATYEKIVFACSSGKRNKMAVAILAQHNKELLVFTLDLI
jgi:molybdopterin/thiamine biosynthesis adenylyltransferase/rhodanese-related sulfurtransferase